jgi:hypothetical protein
MGGKSLLTLVSELKKFEKYFCEEPLNRKISICLLEIIYENLSEILSDDICLIDGIEIVGVSSSISRLGEFIQALSDLDNGKTDEILKPYAEGPTATLDWNDRKVWEMLIKGVDYLKASNQMPEQAVRGAHASFTTEAAVAKVADILRATGATWRGKKIDNDIMLNVYNNRKKSNLWSRDK